MIALSARVSYLNQTLVSLSGLPSLQKMALYVSQDGNDAKVAELIDSTFQGRLKGKARHIEHWYHPRVPLITENQVEGPEQLAGHQYTIFSMALTPTCLAHGILRCHDKSYRTPP